MSRILSWIMMNVSVCSDLLISKPWPMSDANITIIITAAKTLPGLNLAVNLVSSTDYKRNPKLLDNNLCWWYLLQLFVWLVAPANEAFWVWVWAGGCCWGTLTPQQLQKRTKQFIHHKISFPSIFFYQIIHQGFREWINDWIFQEDFFGVIYDGYMMHLTMMASQDLHSSLSVFCLSCLASSGNGQFAL